MQNFVETVRFLTLYSAICKAFHLQMAIIKLQAYTITQNATILNKTLNGKMVPE